MLCPVKPNRIVFAVVNIAVNKITKLFQVHSSVELIQRTTADIEPFNHECASAEIAAIWKLSNYGSGRG